MPPQYYYEYGGKRAADWRELLSPELLQVYGGREEMPTGLTGMRRVEGALPTPEGLPVAPAAPTAAEIAGMEAEMMPGIEAAYAPITQRQVGMLQRTLAEAAQQQIGGLTRGLAARGLTYGGAYPAGVGGIAGRQLAELTRGTEAIGTEAMRAMRGELGTRLATVLGALQTQKAQQWQAQMQQYEAQQRFAELQEKYRLQQEFEKWQKTTQPVSVVYGGGLETPTAAGAGEPMYIESPTGGYMFNPAYTGR